MIIQAGIIGKNSRQHTLDGKRAAHGSVIVEAGLKRNQQVNDVVSDIQKMLRQIGKKCRQLPDPCALEGFVIRRYLKEDLRKLDELSQQVRYMSKYGIETFDDLYADREKIQRDMDALIVRRTKLQNKIRRATPAEKVKLRQEKAGVTEQITALRKQLKLNKAIEVRSAKIQEKTDLLYANEYRAKEAQQQKKSQRRERDAR